MHAKTCSTDHEKKSKRTKVGKVQDICALISMLQTVHLNFLKKKEEKHCTNNPFILYFFSVKSMLNLKSNYVYFPTGN